MVFAPIFSWLWIKLSTIGKEPSTSMKFGMGLTMLGLGYFALNLGNASAVAGLVPGHVGQAHRDLQFIIGLRHALARTQAGTPTGA